MPRNRWFRTAVFTAVFLYGGLPVLRAEDGDAEHGVARIGMINGNASVRRGDAGEWVSAAVNAPLTAEDVIATGDGSRAEIQFDHANFLRLGANTELRITELQNRRYQLQLARGTADFRVLRSSDADVEVDTPSVSVRPRQRGTYRISVLENGESEITVRAGEVEVFTPRGVETLRAGRTMLVRGDPASPEYQVVAAMAEDDWDRWNEQRDRQLERSTSYRYVSPDIYGAESLDGSGRWTWTPEYGYVWMPSVAPDWAPYRNGRWAWTDWYGWSWVSYDPWGWAPYHYGRWFNRAGYGWCWYPGAFSARHYWAPGYVAFFGFGGGSGFGFGFGNVGWVPLAPFETFNPWWGRGYYGGYRNGGFGNRTTVVNNINITNVYRNARVTNGFTAVNSGDFSRGHYNNNFVRASQGDLQRAGVVRGQLGIAPSNGSLHYTDRAAAFVPRASDTNQRFFSHRQPAPVERIPFAQQQRALGGQPAGIAPRAAGPVDTSPRISGGAPAVRGSAPTADGNRGWRRFGEPGGAAAPAAQPNGSFSRNAPAAASQPNGRFSRTDPAAPAAQPNSPAAGNAPASDPGRGWRRFGEPGRQGGSDRPPDARVSGNNSNGERRRMGVDTPAQARPARETPRSSDPGRGWQRFGEPGGNSAPQAPREAAPAAAQPRERSGAVNRFQAPSDTGGRFSRMDSSPRSLQVAPPVVNERSAPRAERPSFGGSGGSYSRGGGAAPSGSYSRGGGSAAPSGGGRSSGGGGGGGDRGGGGGGGGDRGGGHSHGGGRR